MAHTTRRLRKNCAKLFMSELRQAFINFNNFWQVDDIMAELYALYTISTSPYSRHRAMLLNTKVLNFTVSQERLKIYSVRTSSYFNQFKNLVDDDK